MLLQMLHSYGAPGCCYEAFPPLKGDVRWIWAQQGDVYHTRPRLQRACTGKAFVTPALHKQASYMHERLNGAIATVAP